MSNQKNQLRLVYIVRPPRTMVRYTVCVDETGGHSEEQVGAVQAVVLDSMKQDRVDREFLAAKLTLPSVLDKVTRRK